MSLNKYVIGWGVEGIQYAEIYEGDSIDAINEARQNAITEVEKCYPDEIYGTEHGMDVMYSIRELDLNHSFEEDDLDALLDYLDHPDTKHDSENILYDSMAD